ncbi:MAG: hypothetical protein JWN86_4068 [Planctomycetota bacterium]|nr:hypothetical protein [Planctomycetota bacterium]
MLFLHGNYSRLYFAHLEAAHGNCIAGESPHMARFRNPRFAPEFLEKKLSPSGLIPTPPPADVARFDDPEPLPEPEPGLPPLPPPLPTPIPILPG